MGVLTRRPRSRTARLAAAGVALLFAGPPPALGESSVEHRVKAAYVYKFLGFVRWPPEAAASAAATLRVCASGAVPLGVALAALEGRSVGDRRIEVERIERAPEVDDCHVLVLGGGGGARARALLERARERPVLTVGESEHFVRSGGIVQFVLVDETVRFEIDLGTARRAGLEIGSQLLRVAAAVHRDGEEP